MKFEIDSSALQLVITGLGETFFTVADNEKVHRVEAKPAKEMAIGSILNRNDEGAFVFAETKPAKAKASTEKRNPTKADALSVM